MNESDLALARSMVANEAEEQLDSPLQPLQRKKRELLKDPTKMFR